MKVLHKTLVIVLVTSLLLIGSTYLLVENFIIKGFLENELKEAQHKMDMISRAIQVKFEGIEKSLEDWSAWDDTYQFIVDQNEEYVRSNLQDEALITLDINVMLFVNSTNDVVFAKALDLYKGEEVNVPKVLWEEVKSGNSPLLLGSGTSGMILTENGPMMISSKPILKSTKEGPPRGFLIFGRYFDDRVLEWVGFLTGMNLSANILRESSVPTTNLNIVPVNDSFIVGA
ncbi:MAG: CHASE4 domain-containing protein, partial [Candidatus Methanomethylicaceae archaeon]